MTINVLKIDKAYSFALSISFIRNDAFGSDRNRFSRGVEVQKIRRKIVMKNITAT